MPNPKASALNGKFSKVRSCTGPAPNTPARSSSFTPSPTATSSVGGSQMSHLHGRLVISTPVPKAMTATTA